MSIREIQDRPAIPVSHQIFSKTATAVDVPSAMQGDIVSTKLAGARPRVTARRNWLLSLALIVGTALLGGASLGLTPTTAMPAETPVKQKQKDGLFVVAHIDATSEDIMPDQVLELDRLEKAKLRAGDKFDAVARIHKTWDSQDRFWDNWSGQRIYRITPDETAGIDSKILWENLEDSSRPGPERLGRFWGKHMPADRTLMLYLSGHGRDGTITKLRGEHVRHAQSIAEAKSGQRFHIIFPNGCYQGDLHQLSSIGRPGQVALVSETWVGNDATPLASMLAEAALKGGTPQQMAKLMVQVAEKEGTHKTLAAVDIEKFRSFNKAVATMRHNLLQGKFIQQINKAQADSKQFESDHDPVYYDSGQVLANLSKMNFPAEIHNNIRDARRALRNSVIALTTAEDYRGVSGISFRDLVHGFPDD